MATRLPVLEQDLGRKKLGQASRRRVRGSWQGQDESPRPVLESYRQTVARSSAPSAHPLCRFKQRLAGVAPLVAVVKSTDTGQSDYRDRDNRQTRGSSCLGSVLVRVASIDGVVRHVLGRISLSLCGLRVAFRGSGLDTVRTRTQPKCPNHGGTPRKTLVSQIESPLIFDHLIWYGPISAKRPRKSLRI